MKNMKTLLWKIVAGGSEIQFLTEQYDEVISSHGRLFDVTYWLNVIGSEEPQSVLLGKYVKKIANSKIIRKNTRILQPNKKRAKTTAILIADYEGDLHSFIYGYGDTYKMAIERVNLMNEMIFGTGNEIFVPHRDEDGWKVDFMDRSSEIGDLLYVVSEYIQDGLIYQYKIGDKDCHSHGFEGVLSDVLSAMKNGQKVSFAEYEYEYSEQELRLLGKFIDKLRVDLRHDLK